MKNVREKDQGENQRKDQSWSYLDWSFLALSLSQLYLAHENMADSDSVNIPVNRQFTTLYGIITGSLSSNYS